jgi:hypothetical protein
MKKLVSLGAVGLVALLVALLPPAAARHIGRTNGLGPCAVGVRRSVSAPAKATDLSRIDRTIAREPRYQSKPRYCLLVFGLDASTKVWLVLDGDVLYVDRNANGDLTGEDKKVRRGKAPGQVPGDFACGEIVQANGKTICRGLAVSGSPEEGDMWVTVNLDGKHVQSAGVDTNGYLQFADSPGGAPIVHFNGPLTIGLAPETEITQSASFVKKGNGVEIIRKRTARVILPTFVRGDKNAELRVRVGTVGQGKGTFARVHHKELAEGIHPVAELEFPHRVPAKGTIKIKLAIPDRC